MQRRPPQTVAPTATQSLFVLHAVAAGLLHVSQRHFDVVYPGPRQFGFAELTVSVCVVVELLRLICSAATCAPAVGGQSRLVLPQNGFGELPLTSQVNPAFGPVSQVPWRFPSLPAASPMHLGQGFAFTPV